MCSICLFPTTFKTLDKKKKKKNCEQIIAKDILSTIWIKIKILKCELA